MGLFYTFVRGALRLGLRGFFREIEVTGQENVPMTGPLLLLANHHNGMIDPFLLMTATDRPITFVAKAPLFRVPVLGWILKGLRSMPAYRSEDPGHAKEKNRALFEGAVGWLSKGAAVGIFPEGRSHLDAGLVEFKHGAARIAFDAGARGIPVRVALAGIHFEHTRGFRGKVLVQFGPALGLDAYRERYAVDPRAAVMALTDELHERMSDMVLTAENHELVKLADLVEHMAVTDAGGDSDLKSTFERKKALLEGYARLKQLVPDQMEALRRDLRNYQRFLDALGVRDRQIAEDYRAGRVLAFAARNTAVLFLGLPFLAAALAGNLAPYLLCQGAARLSKDLDVRTSVGFMVAFAAFPAWWAALALLAFKAAGPWAAAGAAGLAPLTGAFALGWMDRWNRVLQATWGLWTALFLRAARARLRRMRARILERLEKTIDLWKGAQR